MKLRKHHGKLSDLRAVRRTQYHTSKEKRTSL
nr:MAG TPA: hypothetical protein [Caudoviricetes sp.]